MFESDTSDHSFFYTCHTSKEKKDGRNQSYHGHV